MRYFLISVSLFFLNLPASKASTPELWTLEMCINYAIENNIQIKQQDINIRLAEAALQQSKAAIFPSLNADVTPSINYGRTIDPTTYEFRTESVMLGSASITTNLNVFSGFRRWNSISQQIFNKDAAMADRKQSENDVSLSISSAYLQILLYESQLGLAEEQLEIIGQQVDRTERLVTEGVLAPNMLAEIQAQQSRDELNKVVAENNLELAYLNLKMMMQLDPEIEIRIVRPEVPEPDLSELEDRTPVMIYQTALGTQPSIEAAMLRTYGAERGVSVARSARYPSLNLFAAFRTNYSDARDRVTGIELGDGIEPVGFLVTDSTAVVRPETRFLTEPIPFSEQIEDNFNYAVGLSLNIPIFNGWQVRTQVQRAKLEMQSAQLGERQVKDRLRNDIHQAYATARAAGLRYISAERNQSAAQTAFNYAEERFNIGLMNAVDYNIARNNLVIAETELINSKYEFIFQLKILDFYEGKPLTLD